MWWIDGRVWFVRCERRTYRAFDNHAYPAPRCGKARSHGGACYPLDASGAERVGIRPAAVTL